MPLGSVRVCAPDMLVAAEAMSHGHSQTQDSLGIESPQAKARVCGPCQLRQLIYTVSERTHVIHLGSFSEFGSRPLHSFCILLRPLIRHRDRACIRSLVSCTPVFSFLRFMSAGVLYMKPEPTFNV